MKSWLFILIAVGFSFSVSAQKSRVYYPRVTTIRVAPAYPLYGAGFGYGYGWSPYYGYSPYWNYPRVIEARPSQLSLKLDEINNDYSYQIKTTRRDRSLSKIDRRQKIRDLKHQREDAIIDAKKNFYRKSDTNS